MKNTLLALLVVIGLFVGFTESQDAAAYGCWGSVTSFYKSNGNLIAFGSFGCSGGSGTGKICIDGVCSGSVYLPSTGASRTANVTKSITCLVDGPATYSTARAYVNGSVYSSKTIRRC